MNSQWVNSGQYGSQDLFKSLSDVAITQISHKLAELPKNREQLISLFPTFFKEIGAMRHEIAAAMGSKDKELFGLYRNCALPSGQPSVTTPCDRRYKACGDYVKINMLPFLNAMKKDPKAKQITHGDWRYAVRPIFNNERIELQNLTANVCEKLQAGKPVSDVDWVKAESFQGGIWPVVQKLNTLSFNFLFLIGEVQVKIGQEWVTATRHVTWIILTGGRKVDDQAIREFQDEAVFTLIHTPYRNVDKLVKTAAFVFADAVLWKGNDPRTLSLCCASLCHRLGHAMAFWRGSAAAIEFLIKAIFKFHKLQLELHEEGEKIDLRVMATAWESKFLTIYQEPTVQHIFMTKLLKGLSAKNQFYLVQWCQIFDGKVVSQIRYSAEEYWSWLKKLYENCPSIGLYPRIAIC